MSSEHEEKPDPVGSTRGEQARGSDSEAIAQAFSQLEQVEKYEKNRPHKLSVKQVAGIVIVLGVAPLIALWGFQIVG